MKIALNGMLLGRCYSGVEYSILSLCRALVEHGNHDYRLYVPDAAAARMPAQAHLEIATVRLAARNRLLRLAWEQLRLPRHVAADGCDVLHAPGYLAPLHCDVPVVLTVYDIMALSHPHLCRRLNRINYAFFLPRSMARARAIIVPSTFTAQQIATYAPACAEKTRVIPLPVADIFSNVPGDTDLARVRQEYALPEQFVLFVGRNEPKKNLPALLTAMRILRTEFHTHRALVIAGAQGWGGPDLRQRARELGIEEDVRFVGHVSSGDLPALYRLAELFAFPSLYEGFGLPPLEAMQCGTPVVCANSTALPEVAGDAALLVDPADPRSIAAGLHRVLTEPGLRETLVRRGRLRAAGNSWRTTVERVEEVYRSVREPRSDE